MVNGHDLSDLAREPTTLLERDTVLSDVSVEPLRVVEVVEREIRLVGKDGEEMLSIIASIDKILEVNGRYILKEKPDKVYRCDKTNIGYHRILTTLWNEYSPLEGAK